MRFRGGIGSVYACSIVFIPTYSPPCIPFIFYTVIHHGTGTRILIVLLPNLDLHLGHFIPYKCKLLDIFKLQFYFHDLFGCDWECMLVYLYLQMFISIYGRMLILKARVRWK